MLDGQEVLVGTSIGIACAPGHGATASQLLQSADLGLYRAKAVGRGTFIFFEEGMDMAIQDQHALEIDLRMALQFDEFEVHYQPIVNLANQTIATFEALVRWRHAKLGLVPPDRFIPLAEETGLIVPLGEWILTRACRDAASWPEHINLAVNLSAVQLRQASIVETVASALRASGLAPSRLELEVTETVMLAGSDSIAALTALHELGVKIVLDDFGTGYASFSTLINVPFSKIKIDRAFVAGLPESATCSAIIGAVTALARQLDMRITAEGVETQEQATILSAGGCTEAQGYYFARPLPLSELTYDIPAIELPRRSASGT
jgi:predicted signal transduction protein with EAL and GGDEF domain